MADPASSNGAVAQWQARPEAGTDAGLRFLLWVARTLGRRVLHALLLPVAGYFYLVRAPERRASYAYLSRVFGRPARDSEVLRHFYRFAQVTADRFYFLAGRADDIPVEFVIDPELEKILLEKRPGIFLAAHFGSFEAARVLGPRFGGINLRIVLDKAVNGRFVEMLADVDPDLYRLIIDSEQDPVALGLTIREALDAGDWVGFLADRHRAGDRTLPQQFLGSSAHLPSGPYIIASVFKTPIIGAFCRLTPRGYEVHCEVLCDRMDAPRKERDAAIRAAMAGYAERLEHHVRASPYGWFNFFDFWAEPQ